MRESADTVKEVRTRAGHEISRVLDVQPPTNILIKTVESIAADSHVSGFATVIDLLFPLFEENEEQLAHNDYMHLYFLGRKSALDQIKSMLQYEIKSR